MFRLDRKAQSTLEYALLIFVIVAALIAMQIYMKRGVQGKIKSSTDQIGQQYSPSNTTSTSNTTRFTDTTVNEASGQTSTTYNADTGTKATTETVSPSSSETWPGPATQ